MASLTKQVVARVRALAVGRRVALECRVAPDVETVHVDGPSIIQALVNLVSNGIRFTPDGGKVELRAARDGAWIMLSIVDNGIGIEADRVEHLLERSFEVRDSLNHHSSNTLEFNSAGLGLGLPIARGIVEAHGGRLTLESTPGAGTTLTVRIPMGPHMKMEKAA
jgi:signal transduction histidine kinase